MLKNRASNNTAVGFQAMYSNTTATLNTAIGYQLYSNTTGSPNTAVGWGALYANTTGIENTAIGQAALYQNTDGFNNIAVGRGALFSNTYGSDNTATGFKALFYMDVAADNTAVGSQALINAKLIYDQSDETFYSPEGNTALGSHTLDNNTGGYYNTALGFNADIATSLQHNSVAIGAFANAAASDIVQVGNTSITSIRGQVGWSTFSDGRYKKNIKKDVQGLVFINNLEPITYTVDINKLNDYYDKNKKRDSSYEKMKIYMKKSSDKAAAIVYNGFIAQDVEKTAAKLNYNFSGVDKPQNKDGLYGLRYADFVVPLVKAVQELDKKNEELESEVKELKHLVQQLVQTKSLYTNNSYLSQNIPNPANSNTIIPFQIAKGSHSAIIKITQTSSGKILKTIAVDVNATQVSFNTNSIAAGSYVYYLLVDGKQIDSKQMILSR